MGLRAVCVLLLVLLVAGIARGQGHFDEAGPLATPLPARSLNEYCRMLGLDADQTAAAGELHKGYRAAFLAATARAHKDSEAGADDGAPGHRMTIAQRYVDEVRGLEQQLLNDLKAMCSEGQAAAFPRVERARRRSVGSRISFAAGDGIDMVMLAERLKLPNSPELEEVLLRWEQAVDRVEVERDKLILGVFRTVASDPEAQDDEARIRDFFRELHAVSVRGRDLNRRALREITPLLSAEAAEKLAAEFSRRSFPRIYADSDAERALKAAAGLADLSAEQKEQVQSLAAAYKREAGPINDRWAHASEEKQGEFANDFRNFEPPHSANDPFAAAKAERLALDERTIEKLGRILSDEQRAKLPEPTRQNHGPPEYMPDLGERIEGDWEEFAGET